MSGIQTSSQAIREAISVCGSAIDTLRVTQRGMQSKYIEAGKDWNDSKYQELGAVVDECNQSIKKALRELETCLVPLKNMENSIDEYESVNINSNVSVSNDSDSSFHADNYDSISMDAQVHHVVKNKEEGLRREHFVELELFDLFPEAEGYFITREAHFRDSSGSRVHDPESETGRRIDFVVTNRDGVIIDLIEVTSKTSDKTRQLAKEERIRNAGGNYIMLRDGRLAEIPGSVRTKIVRRELV